MEAWVEALGSMEDEERLASLAYVAGQQVEIDEVELNEALRRALVVRAVGGNPQRELELGEEAVGRLAEELDTAERREALVRALAALRSDVAGRPAAQTLDALIADDALAWRCFAAALLAAELA